ncbi:MAG: S41 family peptidase [Patescibacteria group bacterium]
MRRSFLILSGVLVIFSFLFGFQIGKLQTETLVPSVKVTETTDPVALADLKTFWDVWKRVQERYVDKDALNTRNLIYGAIRGMVAALDDPYTVYMTPEETVEFQNNLEGSLEGIGAELTVKDKMLTVASVLKSSPAEKSGLLTNDAIVEINGETTADMTIYQAITKIRGKGGTKVNLLIFRKSTKSAPFELSILRDKIQLNSVSMEDKGNGIFHVSVNQFTDHTSEEFKKTVQDILLKNPKGMILDLRGNGGGYLDISVDMLSEFLGGNKAAVKIERRNESLNETISVANHPSFPDLPLAVLVNNGSASASEIVAGALQDHRRAIVIGETSFGKGSVQEVEKLPDLSSLRITIAKWLTPKGRSISKIGIMPDIEVKLTEKDLEKGRDTQLERAVQYLRGLGK